MRRRASHVGGVVALRRHARQSGRAARLGGFSVCGRMLVLLLCCAGCSNNKKGPQVDLMPAAGTVTLDGKPLADADIAFYLQGDRPQGYAGSGGKTDAQGKYELTTGAAKGAAAGSYKVTISQYRDANGGPVVISEGMDLQQLKMQGQAKEMLPPRYSDMEKTELKATVEKSKADGYDFPLKSS